MTISPSFSSRTHLRINDDRCHLCRRCLVQMTCRGMAVIRFDREEAPVIDIARCLQCMVCMPACPFGAVELVNSTAG